MAATTARPLWAHGEGLDLQTTNGGATVYVPRGYNALLETGTTNGGMRVDFPITVRGSLTRYISTQQRSGGPRVRVVTTNGGVRIALWRGIRARDGVQ